MGYPHYDLVLRSQAELIQEGKIKKRDNQEAVEQDKGLMTRRSGYYSNQQDPYIGILEKTSGNQSEGYSVDILIHKDGRFWDIATDDGTMCKPVNGSERGPDPELAARWRQPTKELAQIEGQPGPGPDPDPGPGPGPSNDEVLQKLDQVLAAVAEVHQRQAMDTAMILERDDYNTQRVLDRLTQIVTDFEASAKKVLAIYLAMNRPGGEVPPGGGEGELPPDGMLALILKLLQALGGGNLGGNLPGQTPQGPTGSQKGKR